MLFHSAPHKFQWANQILELNDTNLCLRLDRYVAPIVCEQVC